MTSSHQQSLADAGSKTRPPMLQRGSYVPWSSLLCGTLIQEIRLHLCMNVSQDNDMDQNKIRPINMAVNTKFLNSFPPEWNEYVTYVRLTNKLNNDHYDGLFDHLQQYEALVNASRAKKAANIDDPLL
ncbi:hypothetical protein Tco_1517452 [Tanacetum coccineum]